MHHHLWKRGASGMASLDHPWCHTPDQQPRRLPTRHLCTPPSPIPALSLASIPVGHQGRPHSLASPPPAPLKASDPRTSPHPAGVSPQRPSPCPVSSAQNPALSLLVLSVTPRQQDHSLPCALTLLHPTPACSCRPGHVPSTDP